MQNFPSPESQLLHDMAGALWDVGFVAWIILSRPLPKLSITVLCFWLWLIRFATYPIYAQWYLNLVRIKANEKPGSQQEMAAICWNKSSPLRNMASIKGGKWSAVTPMYATPIKTGSSFTCDPYELQQDTSHTVTEPPLACKTTCWYTGSIALWDLMRYELIICLKKLIHLTMECDTSFLMVQLCSLPQRWGTVTNAAVSIIALLLFNISKIPWNAVYAVQHIDWTGE